MTLEEKLKRTQAQLRRMKHAATLFRPDARIQVVQRVVADYYGLLFESMQSQFRYARVAQPRMIAMTLTRELTPQIALSVIGAHFGGRDHGTVMHAIETVHNWADIQMVGLRGEGRIAAELTELRALIQKALKEANL